MKNKKKTIILSSIILGVLVLTLGITYAIFSYQETSNNTSQLIMGDIYMHYKENNQLILNNAMPQEGFKTLVTGYEVNPIMATQDAEDTSTELYACIDFFENELGWGLDDGEDFESFCRGTGTNWGLTLQMYLDDMFTDENGYNELLSLNIIKEKSIEYTSIKLNPEIKTQTAEYENELTACVYFFEIYNGWGFDEGSTAETYCQGTGTVDGGILFQELLDDWMVDDRYYFEFLSSNNIIIEDGESYIVNPDMANQTVGNLEINGLQKCILLASGGEFDEGSTAESFCRGEGTYDGGITLKKEFEYYSDDIEYMVYFGNDLLENNIIIAKVDLPYFEFTISGKNTYSEQDIYYEVLLNHGDPHDTRNTRLEDNFLKFRLIEVNPDKTEKIIFDNKSYSNIENKKIHTEIISKNTMNEINKTYRLYMWIDEDVVIGNYNQDYTIEEWNDVFASVKVNVSGEIKDSVPLSTVFKDVLRTKPDTTVTDETGTIYVSGSKESGSVFVGDWATHELQIPDVYKVDYNYVWYSGKLWRITSVNSDGTMKLITDNPITNISFGESGLFEDSYVREWLNQEFLPTLYNYENVIETDYKWDVTPTDTTAIKSSNPILIENPVGLLTAYEYLKSYQVFENIENVYDVEESEASYLNVGIAYYLMTSTTSPSPYYVRTVNFYGDDDGFYPYSLHDKQIISIRPAIVLKSTVMKLEGDGSYNNPYKISEDLEPVEKNVTLINKRRSGEYVKLENDESGHVFRIIDTERIEENLTTKLVLNDLVSDTNDTDSDGNKTEILNKRFGTTALWNDIDKNDETYWRGYLNNVWITEIDNTYDEATGVSSILEKGKYYLGYFTDNTSSLSWQFQENPNYKMTVCDEVNSDISVRQCIENNQVVSNVVSSDYVGMLRVGEMFATALKSSYNSYYSYFSITPSNTSLIWANTRSVFDGDHAMAGYSSTSNVDYTHYARPTINLKSNLVIKSGSGTEQDPFIVGLPS